MSRLLYGDLEPEDVLLADQAYGSYVDLALVQQQGADAVFRKHHARQTDFRVGAKNWELATIKSCGTSLICAPSI